MVIRQHLPPRCNANFLKSSFSVKFPREFIVRMITDDNDVGTIMKWDSSLVCTASGAMLPSKNEVRSSICSLSAI